MPYEIHESDDGAVLTIAHTGVVTIAEIEAAAVDFKRLKTDALLGWVMDMRGVESRPDDADSLVWLIDRKDAPPFQAGKAALLVLESQYDEWEFIALASRNRGAVLWCFTDETKALEWVRTPIEGREPDGSPGQQ